MLNTKPQTQEAHFHFDPYKLCDNIVVFYCLYYFLFNYIILE